ncbi:MAG TPA: hypothetical protein VGD47_03960, partial [Steroidobacteraceae bacterium]
MRTIAALAAVLVSTAALADTTTRYTVIFDGRPGGSQVTTVRPDGRIDVAMSYRINGRGPDLKERLKLAADGTLASFQVSGKSTFGAPINESFTRHGNTAQWRSLADHGTATLAAAAALYVPIDNTFEVPALIARAAMQRPQGRIAALPAGEIRVEKVLDARLEASGHTAPVALYGITGIGTQPDFV